MTAPDYPFPNPPAPGTTIEVAPGLHWLRMALPFRRKLDTGQIFFAMGEAIAHLHYLHYDGSLARTVGADGVVRFAPG